ncbi:MAG: ABC transporter ATP-binding protein [Opitutaceae bacterium]|nr:ABC transporter ATP-binding protein [Opitutaceae bacterium]
MTPLLELRHLRYAYPASGAAARPPALDDVSLAIPPGARLALLGANGAGKSTVLWHLNGTLHPTSGDILLGGKPVRHSRAELTELRRHVALVTQEPDDQLFAGTVRQDVSFGPLNLGLSEFEAAERVDAVLAALDLTAFADLPPHQLSHGQRKRVALAGALAMRPELLALDEPTAGLDPRGIEALHRQLDTLHAQGLAIVLTTHDIDFAHRWASEVVVMDAGRIAARGPAAEIFAEAALLHRAGLRQPYTIHLRDAAVAPP